MKHVLFVRGYPAVGKITTARSLEKELGWKVLWIHDIKNVIFNVIGDHNLRNLMKTVLEAILKELMERNENVIFVRTAMNNETVERVKQLVESQDDYDFQLVTLLASKETLLSRVASRETDLHRPSSQQELEMYLDRVPDHESFSDKEIVVDTDKLSVEGVTQQILSKLNL